MSHSQTVAEPVETRPQSTVTRRPCRVRHEHELSLAAAPDAVFPLLCPVRELDWVSGWAVDWVLSDSGLAEERCVFQTPNRGERDGGSAPAIWVVTMHDPRAYRLQMVKVVPGHTVTVLDAGLAPDGNGGTRAAIAYEYTALGAEAETFVRAQTSDAYRDLMAEWETALNAYLARGAE